MASRRQFARKQLRVRAVFAVEGQPPTLVRTFDISPGGIGLAGEVNPVPTTHCTVRVALPINRGSNVVVEFEGRVIYSVFSSPDRVFKIGIQFVSMSEEVRSVLLQYLAM